MKRIYQLEIEVYSDKISEVNETAQAYVRIQESHNRQYRAINGVEYTVKFYPVQQVELKPE